MDLSEQARTGVIPRPTHPPSFTGRHKTSAKIFFYVSLHKHNTIHNMLKYLTDGVNTCVGLEK